MKGRLKESVFRWVCRSGMDGWFHRVSDRYRVRRPSDSVRFIPVVRRTKRNLLVLAYHRVNDDESPVFPATPIDAFERQMEYLSRRCRPLPLEEAVEMLERNDLPERAVSVTFDDGYRDNFRNAFPILSGYRIPATVFLATGAIDGGRGLWHDRLIRTFLITGAKEVSLPFLRQDPWPLRSKDERVSALRASLRYFRTADDSVRRERVEETLSVLGEPEGDEQDGMLSWHEVQRMREGGVSFGAHTVSHPVLSRTARGAASREIRESKRELESRLGAPVTVFAYPFGLAGDFSDETKTLTRDAGFRCAVSAIFGFQEPGMDLFEIRRVMPWQESIASFAVKMGWYRFLS